VLVVKILSSIAFVASIAWCIKSPDYEPAIAIVTSLIALVASWRSGEKNKRSADQKQVIGEKGFGIQAGGDVTTGDIKQGGRDAR
jgi:hypothetical protein